MTRHNRCCMDMPTSRIDIPLLMSWPVLQHRLFRSSAIVVSTRNAVSSGVHTLPNRMPAHARPSPSCACLQVALDLVSRNLKLNAGVFAFAGTKVGQQFNSGAGPSVPQQRDPEL
jgi:hypothetical protein